MPSCVAGTVGDVGRRLRPAVVDDTHPGGRLLHNLVRPRHAQLDPGSVTELRLAAPFVDSFR